MPDASWGYTAEEGLKAVLGGENIDKINRREGAMTPGEMRRYIESAPDTKDVSYSDESRRFARLVLTEADKNPDLFLSNSRKFSDKLFEGGDYNLTGFMFGWAVNAVRYVLGTNPIQNPAVISLSPEGL